MKTFFKALMVCLAFLMLSLTSCSTAILAERGPYLRAYHEGAFCQAEQQVNVLACQTKARENYQCSNEANWILLDRATLHFAMGKIEEAISDYAQALESLDYYDQDLLAEQCAQLLIQDETAAYQADDFEQVLARLYFAFVLLHKGDTNNAYALLRQAEEYQQKKRELYAKVPFTKDYCVVNNGLSQYLFALLLEKRGDFSNATLLYQQAHPLLPCAQKIPCYSCQTKQQATLLIVCHNGNAPYKISTACPGSIASACALEFLLSTQSVNPTWSTLTGIPVPALQTWPGSFPLSTYAQIDGIQRPLLPFYNVSQAASEQLKQKLPVIVARGVARLLMRRCAVEYCNRQDSCLGMLADVTLFFLNGQTRADTRSWTTLPALLDVARFDVEPGCHQLELQICESMGLDQHFYTLHLKSNDLCLIHIFNIHPGVRQILIPSRYLN